MALTSLDYWKLSDALSVVDAAILITGNDPSKKEKYRDGNYETYEQKTSYDGFDAAYKALRNAVLGNKIQATIAFDTRTGINSEYNHPQKQIKKRK